jgi:hypothetical protein
VIGPVSGENVPKDSNAPEPDQNPEHCLQVRTDFSSAHLSPDNVLHLVLEGQQMVSELLWRPNNKAKKINTHVRGNDQCEREIRDNYKITYMSMKPAILSNGIVVYSFRYDLEILTVIYNVLPNFKFLL